jgi:hypothetical protein
MEGTIKRPYGCPVLFVRLHYRAPRGGEAEHATASMYSQRNKLNLTQIDDVFRGCSRILPSRVIALRESYEMKHQY